MFCIPIQTIAFVICISYVFKFADFYDKHGDKMMFLYLTYLMDNTSSSSSPHPLNRTRIHVSGSSMNVDAEEEDDEDEGEKIELLERNGDDNDGLVGDLLGDVDLRFC